MFKLKWSFKTKTILGIAAIETFFLFILVLNSRTILYETVELDIQDRAQNISNLIATASVDAVISHDLATLESILDSTITTTNILYIKILDLDGVMAERGNPVLLDKEFKADSNLSESDLDGSYDAYSDIVIDGYKFGRVEIGLSVQDQKSIISKTTNHLSTIALIELLFAALFSFILGIALTKRLTVLQEGAIKISQGQTGLQIPVTGEDEVSDVSKAFNLMSTKIGEVTQTLKSDNARMDAVMNTVTDAIFMASLDGEIHSMNRAAYALFDCTDKDIVNRSLFDFIPSFKLDSIHLSTNRNVQSVDGLSSSGRKIPLEIHSSNMQFDNQTYIVGVIRDLTEINKLQYELNAVFNISPNGFMIVSKDKTISYVNPAFYTLFSIEPGSLIGQNWQYFTNILTKLIDKELHNNLRLLDDLSNENVLYLLTPVEKVFSVYRQNISDADIDSSDILFFCDITHLTIVDKMKSEFLSTAAHELRTPLASICGFSELLLTRSYDKSTAYEMSEIIHRQALNLKYLIDELLDLARIEAKAGKDFNMKNQSIEKVVRESCIDVEGAFNGRKVDIQTSLEWPILYVDIEKIRQVLKNLLSNAFKYSPNEQSITLTTLTRKNSDRFQFGIRIIDNGIGMSPEQLGRLGERFYRVDDSGHTPGTGLGVSVVKEIIAIHGGETEFVSEEGKGMTATVWLPIIKNS
ncbi:ATP-binding protein [Vibrio sp. MA40-2]|uniref:ATP-binding protein n=1 Tax=Vibrio sp. MA40-2 TaxID=3391828 RepID=UPI0039A676BA